MRVQGAAAWRGRSGCRTSRSRCCAGRWTRSARRSPATSSSITCCSGRGAWWSRRGRSGAAVCRLRAAGAGAAGRARGTAGDRAQARGDAGAGGAEMAAGPGRRRRDPEGGAAGESQQANLDALQDRVGRHRPGGDRDAAEGPAVREPGLCAGLGPGRVASDGRRRRARPASRLRPGWASTLLFLANGAGFGGVGGEHPGREGGARRCPTARSAARCCAWRLGAMLAMPVAGWLGARRRARGC